MRYRVTTALLNPRRGSEQYQAMNSSIACSQHRLELGERKLARINSAKTFNFDFMFSSSNASRDELLKLLAAPKASIPPNY
jgi:hypothetical protein